MVRYYIRLYERMIKVLYPKCSEKAGKVIEQGITIIDAEGVSMSLLTGKVKKMMELASKAAQDYYPECLGRMFVINTGFFFGIVWAFAKAFIDKKTRNKIQIEKSSYKKALLEYVIA